ncbi:SH3 domain-containing protein [Thomasclavelia sp.]|uniref:SH3 domain-containing protein n=1 Tax=Thomasclavelia sp. TaxID=3025757 RepID=UPI0025F5EDE0|nr:SH3 domain-containing protein [Thomasclavelia sp.]
MNNVETVLNIARGWIGLNEADGSHKEIIDIYNAHTPLARGYKVKYTDSWCAVFVSAVAIKANATDVIPLECGAEQMVKLFKNMGAWQEDSNYIPKPGDVIFYDWDGKDTWSDHVGYVESVSGNNITAIEGNKSDAVGRRTIAIGSQSIRGYGIVNYDGTSANATPNQPTTNTASGTSVNYKVKVNTPSGVNCRAEPNVSGKKITAYANGTVLTVSKENNGWLYVNGTGWVSGEYCTKVTGGSNATGKATGTYEVRVDSALVVRSGPGTNYSRKSKSQLTKDGQKHSNANGGLLNGTRVTVSEWNGNWAKIPSGWVSGDYLVKV